MKYASNNAFYAMDSYQKCNATKSFCPCCLLPTDAVLSLWLNDYCDWLKETLTIKLLLLTGYNNRFQDIHTTSNKVSRINPFHYLQNFVCPVFFPPVKHFFPHLDCFINVKLSSFQKSTRIEMTVLISECIIVGI